MRRDLKLDFLELLQWKELVPALSLDLTRGFLPSMGLEPAALQDAAQSAARRVIVEFPGAFGVASRFSIVDSRAPIEDFITHLESECGSDPTNAFMVWITSVAYQWNRLNHAWYVYQSAMHSWRGAMRRHVDPIEFENAPSILTLYDEFQQYRGGGKTLRQDCGDVRELIEATKATGLSVWDRGLYDRMPYSNDEDHVRDVNLRSEFVEMYYAFDPILRTVQQNRFQLFWESLLEIASDGNLEKLHAFAEKNAQTSLPQPREVRRNLRPT